MKDDGNIDRGNSINSLVVQLVLTDKLQKRIFKNALISYWGTSLSCLWIKQCMFTYICLPLDIWYSIINRHINFLSFDNVRLLDVQFLLNISSFNIVFLFQYSRSKIASSKKKTLFRYLILIQRHRADPELFAGEGVPTDYFVYRRGGSVGARGLLFW